MAQNLKIKLEAFNRKYENKTLPMGGSTSKGLNHRQVAVTCHEIRVKIIGS